MGTRPIAISRVHATLKVTVPVGPFVHSDFYTVEMLKNTKKLCVTDRPMDGRTDGDLKIRVHAIKKKK